MTQRLPINPETLIWLREGLNATVEDVARWAGTSTNIVEQWESADIHPTVNQTEKVAKNLMVSVPTLLRPPRPNATQPLVSFRKQFGSEHRPPSYALLREVEKAQTRRDQLWSLLSEDEFDPEPFSLLLDAAKPPKVAADTIRAWANIPHEQMFFKPHVGRHMLNVWIDAIEEQGVAVVHMEGVDIDEARGLAIKDPNMPIILLNPGDKQHARTFTLLHELVHLGLAKNDWAQGPLKAALETNTDRATERFCNQVTAELMLPANLIQQYVQDRWNVSSQNPIDNTRPIRSVARQYSASLSVTAIRLKELQLIVPQVADEFLEEIRSVVVSSESQSGGGDYYRNTVQRIGRAYSRAVLQAYHDGLISYATAGDMLQARQKGGVDQIRARL